MNLSCSRGRLDSSRPLTRKTYCFPVLPGVLLLNDNGLTGTLPSELGLLTMLTTLLLNGNELSGVVPSEVGDLILLGEFKLRVTTSTSKYMRVTSSEVLLTSIFRHCGFHRNLNLPAKPTHWPYAK